MDKKMVEGLTKQITHEFYSGYLYLQMAAWFEENNLKGFANWMRVQFMEESCHAMIFFNYLIERGVPVKLGQINMPESDFKSPLDIFERSLKHEQFVTGLINNLANTAIEVKDHASRIMLDWFVTEQVEEEANATEVIEKLKLMGEKPGSALMMYDAVLAQRTFSKPSPLK